MFIMVDCPVGGSADSLLCRVVAPKRCFSLANVQSDVTFCDTLAHVSHVSNKTLLQVARVADACLVHAFLH